MKKIFESYHAAAKAAAELQISHAIKGWLTDCTMSICTIEVVIHGDEKTRFPIIKDKEGAVMPYTTRERRVIHSMRYGDTFSVCKYKFQWIKNSLT